MAEEQLSLALLSELEKAGGISVVGLHLSNPDLPPEVDRAWAAGFFDGEGWTGITHGSKPCLRMAVAQAQDYDSLRRFHAIMGVGRLYGPYSGKRKGWAPQMYFYVHNDSAVRVYEIMQPYLGQIKKQQAVLAKITWLYQRERNALAATRRREQRKRQTRERTHCIRGHALVGDNIYYMPEDPRRPNCRECQRARGRAYYHRSKVKKT